MTTTSDNFKLHNVIDLTDEEFKLIADLVYQANTIVNTLQAIEAGEIELNDPEINP